MGYQIITKMVYNARTHQIETWQTCKWRKVFETLFREYPELRMDSYQDELNGKFWPEHCAVCRRFEELAGSKSPHEPQSAGANSIPYIIYSLHNRPILFFRAFFLFLCPIRRPCLQYRLLPLNHRIHMVDKRGIIPIPFDDG